MISKVSKDTPCWRRSLSIYDMSILRKSEANFILEFLAAWNICDFTSGLKDLARCIDLELIDGDWCMVSSSLIAIYLKTNQFSHNVYITSWLMLLILLRVVNLSKRERQQMRKHTCRYSLQWRSRSICQ